MAKIICIYVFRISSSSFFQHQGLLPIKNESRITQYVLIIVFKKKTKLSNIIIVIFSIFIISIDFVIIIIIIIVIITTRKKKKAKPSVKDLSEWSSKQSSDS